MDPSHRTDAPIFLVRNQHAAASGTPPLIDDASPGRYLGYFENAYGDQAIFIYERDTDTAALYLGDAGWQTPHAVIDGVAPDLRLAEPELTWLRACWHAARGTRR